MKKTVVLLLLLSLITGTLGAVQAEEKPELRVLTEYSTIDANADPTAALLEQLTGYKVVYVALPNEERLPKLNAILASREPYDIMILSPDSFANTVHLGAFMPLDELLAQAGQAVQQGTNPSLWTSATVDGAILWHTLQALCRKLSQWIACTDRYPRESRRQGTANHPGSAV